MQSSRLEVISERRHLVTFWSTCHKNFGQVVSVFFSGEMSQNLWQVTLTSDNEELTKSCWLDQFTCEIWLHHDEMSNSQLVTKTQIGIKWVKSGHLGIFRHQHTYGLRYEDVWIYQSVCTLPILSNLINHTLAQWLNSEKTDKHGSLWTHMYIIFLVSKKYSSNHYPSSYRHILNKKHSENADTSTSLIIRLY